MYDFQSLLDELLQQRPEISREEVMRKVDEKKRNIGAGYLTDQGALFLVAGELGVSLVKDNTVSDMMIKDLYIGANDVTVTARILGVYPEATFNRKDGGKGKYRRITLFDGSDSVRLTVWEEGIGQLQNLKLEVDSPVRVANAYVKQGLDGKPNLNLGKRGRIEVLADQEFVSKLPSISTLVQKMPNLSKEEQFVAIEGAVSSEPRYSEFVRSDGSEGSLFQFGVAQGGGKETRVVIWSPAAQPELKIGQKVNIVNVRAKRSNRGDFEVHGDAGSTILVGKQIAMLELRIAALSSTQSTKIALGLGKDRKIKIIEMAQGVKEPALGDLVGIVPDEVTEGRLRCKSANSLRILEDGSFPGIAELSTKLQNAKEEDVQIMVEVIALSHGSVDDVRLRDGTVVKKGELVIGDDTGDVKLVAWRDLSARLFGIQPGERLRVVGVVPKSTKMGGLILQISNFTVLERLRGST